MPPLRCASVTVRKRLTTIIYDIWPPCGSRHYCCLQLTITVSTNELARILCLPTEIVHRMQNHSALILVIVLLNGFANLWAQQPSELPPSKIGQLIEPLAKAHAGDVAVAIRHLGTGEHYEWNAERPQATASLIKFPIMIEAYRQAVDDGNGLHRVIEISKSEMVEGSGILTAHFSAGTRISVRDTIRLMIAFSDNTATNLVLDKIGLPATGKTMAEWGYPETRVNSKVFRRETSIDSERSLRYGLGSTTAHDMVDLLAKLYAGKILTPGVCKDMLDHLAACDDKQKFPALLPSGTKIYHKTGSVAKVRTDAGIIETPGGPVALCVLTENNEDTSWTPENAGDRLCAQVAKVTYDFFAESGKKNASAAADSAPAQLAKGATGDLVEALQRTLNARTTPSPNLGIDGDFGSATESAVKAYQAQHQLTVTGIVDRKTLESLSPLLMEDQPVPDPEVVNGQTFPKTAADDPYGQPVVTAKAWAIADLSTGKILWGNKQDVALDIASTTKIMTAYLVLRFCEKQPAVLQETVTFSHRADNTLGSTSALREGENVSVGDLLYGLLLPSGNDAAVALAEHFGAKLTKADSKKDGYEAFIDMMNSEAKRIEMNKTHFVNPHGLTATDHKSSCGDMIRLTTEAIKLPLFQKITGTVQYGCRVTGKGGYVRNVKWENTNQLLSIDGYSGVKTGTTDAAGACLVSIGSRKDRKLVTVVLGSAASASRYADTRNLFAWAWRELEK